MNIKLNGNTDLKKVELDSLVTVAMVMGADSLEEALYYLGDNEEAKDMLKDMMDKAMNDPNTVKRADLLFELETLGMSEEELEEIEKIKRIRKLGYTGTSIEDLSKEFDMPVEAIRTLFEKNFEVNIHVLTSKGLVEDNNEESEDKCMDDKGDECECIDETESGGSK